MCYNIIRTDAQKSTLLIRLMVGVVFLSEGIQKFLFPNKLGSGRMEKIGISFPEVSGYLVGGLEIICGTLVLIGLMIRLAVSPLIIIMIVAMVSTKYPILINEGFWPMMHAGRTDWCMFLGCVYLFIKGGGKWSVDYRIQRK